MKKGILITFCLIITELVFSQDTTVVINYYEDSYNKQINEKFSISLTDSLKNGNYISYFKTGMLKCKGKFKNDLKVGVWEYYDKDTWKVYLKFDHSNFKELFYAPTYKEQIGEFGTIKEGEYISFSKKPYCPEFEPDLVLRFSNYLQKEIERKNIFNDFKGNGRIFIYVKVDKEGNIQASHWKDVMKPSKEQLEIIKIIENSPKWVPGEINGEKVDYEFIYKIII